MLAIPAIDVYLGKVARLHKGDFATAKFYNGSPLDYSVKYDELDFSWLHLVDLSASVNGKISVSGIVQEIKNATKLKIEFGGGIKTYEQAKEAFSFGVDRIVLGSMTISSKYRIEKIVVATDSKNEMILIKGWTEESSITLWQHLEYCSQIGIKYFLCTDIAKDGTLEGPNINLYERIMEKFPKINLIASGGVSSVKDLEILHERNIYASVVGKAIYENKITLEELKKFVS